MSGEDKLFCGKDQCGRPLNNSFDNVRYSFTTSIPIQLERGTYFCKKIAT